MTLVTVAIPTYRRDRYLKDALESVLAQTVTDLEIVVSDNASSESTRALVDSYRDPRIVYSPLGENIGIHGNLTRCLHLGSAPYVAVLLDDDTMYPDNLEKKLAALDEHPTAGLAHAALDYIDHTGDVTIRNQNWTGSPDPARFETGREFLEQALAYGTRVCTSSALVRRTAVASRCHDERDRAASDLGLWLRMALSWDFVFVSEVLTTVRVHAESASAESGLYEAGDDISKLSLLPTTVAVRDAKLRFLAEYETSRRDRRHLRHLIRDRARTELKKIVADETLSERRPLRTLTSLYGVSRVESSFWWSPWSAVLLASSFLGRRFFDDFVQMRAGRQ
jgi:glycosyltransferase involved in cell wall biosynthesis